MSCALEALTDGPRLTGLPPLPHGGPPIGRPLGVLALALCVTAASCVDPSGADDESIESIESVAGRCPETSAAPPDPFADCVADFDPAPGVSFGHHAMPDIVQGPPHGGGARMGSTHVASLGCGGSITLHFAAPWPTDRPGPDFVVFENAFISGDAPFVEPARVLVSPDGERWRAFDCDFEAEDPAGCAGRTPVHATEASFGAIEPGGDAFDLADVGLREARYVRLEDRTAEHYRDDLWCAGAGGGFDLDAIAVLEPAP